MLYTRHEKEKKQHCNYEALVSLCSSFRNGRFFLQSYEKLHFRPRHLRTHAGQDQGWQLEVFEIIYDPCYDKLLTMFFHLDIPLLCCCGSEPWVWTPVPPPLPY